ncbi:glutamate 5-kinase [Legionella impletisoli]|uniref:Glutamate 5-kinase n=1 Tax=Legionella impletisoli TaxID=343510 RepID=A0A917JSH9_9GAMM|nr:glutamate 5-kinase [Legionella impletisoli]GGI79384.1 glutamate 5-kinase [Legionella impletisoli]
MKLIIKVGTQSILSQDGDPFFQLIDHLVAQLARLQLAGHQLVLVSSGAVSSGRKIAREHLERQYGHSIGEKQTLASLGQVELMRLFADAFKPYNLLVSQLLLTKQDFHTRKHYLNIARLFRELLNQQYIIPIVNENDSVAIEELMFTDNDELAGLIAAQLGADKLIILSNVPGVYTDEPGSKDAELISIIDPNQSWPEVSMSKSIHGRGGMFSKLATAKKISSLGITTHIACIKEPNVIERIVNQESLGTIILPNKRKSNIKRWIAFADRQNASVYINAELYRLLKDTQQTRSLLPIGLVKINGTFKKGDLINICSLTNERVGVGIARYDSTRLNEFIGQKGKPVFIHYDQLHIF